MIGEFNVCPVYDFTSTEGQLPTVTYLVAVEPKYRSSCTPGLHWGDMLLATVSSYQVPMQRVGFYPDHC